MAKCSECGFLGLRRREDRAILEAENGFRESGENPERVQGNSGRVYEDRPICCALVADFREEVLGAGHQSLLDAMGRERDCGRFTSWHPGFTPKEHQEMIDRKWQQEREDKRDDEMRSFQAEQAKLADQRHRQTLWYTLLAAALGAVATLAAVKLAPAPTIIVNPASAQAAK